MDLQFAFDQRLDRYKATVSWEGSSITLNVADLEECITAATELLRSQIQWNSRICDCAAANLIGLKNESWLDDDEAAVTPEEFKSRIHLYAITVNSSDRLEFWFRDGGLFDGHSILVKASLTNGPARAEIAG